MEDARSLARECRTDPYIRRFGGDRPQILVEFHDTQLHVLAGGAPLLHVAEAREAVFREYCGRALGDINSPQRLIDPAPDPPPLKWSTLSYGFAH